MKILRLLIFFLFASVDLFAQPGPPPEDPDKPVPLQGLFFLLLAGAALGVKKFQQFSKRKDN